jgi:hypothetical protein
MEADESWSNPVIFGRRGRVWCSVVEFWRLIQVDRVNLQSPSSFDLV